VVTSAFGNLSAQQRMQLDRWLPGASVERDHSWGLVQMTVLELTRAGSRFIVKAGGPNDRHIVRELHAHRHWLGPWTSRGRAPTLVHGSAEAKLLVTRYLPGELVVASDHVNHPATFGQAGELLARLHAQTVVADDAYERRENQKSLAWLSGAHRIATATVERLRRDRRLADAAGDPRAHPRGLAAPELARPQRRRERHRLRSGSDASGVDGFCPAGRPGLPPRP
jgi:hypothetical protein